MHGVYSVAAGSLFLLSLALFLCGSIYRIISILLIARKTERFVFRYISVKHSIQSVLHWILPFASQNWLNNPVLTVVTFSFHVCCIITPLFLLSHVVLLEESFNLSWWTFPAVLSDIMALVVLVCLIFFLIRRVSCKEVKFITTTSDYAILLLIAIPFLTGFMAYHQWFAYDTFIIAHILSSEVLLILIPHTHLSHMFFFFLMRAYIGSEFGKVRGVKDW